MISNFNSTSTLWFAYGVRTLFRFPSIFNFIFIIIIQFNFFFSWYFSRTWMATLMLLVIYFFLSFIWTPIFLCISLLKFWHSIWSIRVFWKSFVIHTLFWFCFILIFGLIIIYLFLPTLLGFDFYKVSIKICLYRFVISLL